MIRRPPRSTLFPSTTLSGSGGPPVVSRQIGGALARRIVTRTGVGQRLATGERMGLMKFGSRMDVFVPPECTLAVTTGQRVRGGGTVIARWPGAGWGRRIDVSHPPHRHRGVRPRLRPRPD